MTHTFGNTGCSFTVNQITQADYKTAHHKGPKNTTFRAMVAVLKFGMGSCGHLSYGHLSTWEPLCWEQRNHSEQNQPNYSKNMEWRSLDLCSHSVTLKASDYFGID